MLSSRRQSSPHAQFEKPPTAFEIQGLPNHVARVTGPPFQLDISFGSRVPGPQLGTYSMLDISTVLSLLRAKLVS